MEEADPSLEWNLRILQTRNKPGKVDNQSRAKVRPNMETIAGWGAISASKVINLNWFWRAQSEACGVVVLDSESELK